jgi:serine/threonine-protein kinase
MGLILFEALTGSRAFDRGSEMASMEAICFDPVERADSVSAPLWEVLETALAKEPAARFRNAQEMADALVAVCPPAREAELGRLVSTRFPDKLRDFLRMDRTPAAGTPAEAVPGAPTRALPATGGRERSNR